MISPHYYNRKNLTSRFFKGNVRHFLPKDPSITVEWYDYIIKANETIYTIAERIFGKGLEYMWTYIADNNPPRMPDAWSAGDTIRLPKVILRDSDTIRYA